MPQLKVPCTITRRHPAITTSPLFPSSNGYLSQSYFTPHPGGTFCLRHESCWFWTSMARTPLSTAAGPDTFKLIPLTIEEVPGSLIENMKLLDVTERFNGSVGTLKRAVESGKAKLPRDGVCICSRRLSMTKGEKIFYLVKQSQMKHNQDLLTGANMIGKGFVSRLVFCRTHMQSLVKKSRQIYRQKQGNPKNSPQTLPHLKGCLHQHLQYFQF